MSPHYDYEALSLVNIDIYFFTFVNIYIFSMHWKKVESLYDWGIIYQRDGGVQAYIYEAYLYF
jgi:hypothetical protein